MRTAKKYIVGGARPPVTETWRPQRPDVAYCLQQPD